MAADVEQERELARRLREAGFQVGPAKRLSGGIHVRVRSDSQDESVVDRIAAEVAPGAKRGPSATPTHDLIGYRDDR